MTSFCQHCGVALAANARFCSNCGAAVSGTAALPRRPLVRPIAGRKIAGVCLGVAQSYGLDVVPLRIFAIIGLFFSCGLVAVAYLAGWICIPEETVALP
jgi:phage shock protein C